VIILLTPKELHPSQLADLTGLLRDRGLAADRIRQILGGNAADLLGRIIP
jgi:microsomal dipeptidase-like Zn-dependent dipeptidase